MTHDTPMRAPLTAALLVLMTACAADRASFRPREKVLAESPDGYPAALYVLDDEGETVGEVRVWSAGAWREAGEEDRTVIHLGLEIENRTGKELKLDLDSTDLRNVQAEGEIRPIERLDVRGDPSVDNRSVNRIDLLFGLPVGSASPGALQNFHARWLVQTETKDFDQVTPFRREYRSAYDNSPWRWRSDFYYGYGWPYYGFGFYGYRHPRYYW